MLVILLLLLNKLDSHTYRNFLMDQDFMKATSYD